MYAAANSLEEEWDINMTDENLDCSGSPETCSFAFKDVIAFPAATVRHGTGTRPCVKKQHPKATLFLLRTPSCSGKLQTFLPLKLAVFHDKF